MKKLFNFMLSSIIAMSATNLVLAQNNTAIDLPVDSANLPQTIAYIGEQAIHKDDYAKLLIFLNKRNQAMPATKEDAKQLVDNYAFQLYLVEKAKKEGLDQTSDFITYQQMVNNELLANAYISKITQQVNVTDQEVRSAYQTEVENLKKAPASERKEYKAAHILVKNKSTANKIINDLRNKRISFANAAKRYGQDNTAETAGDLGWFREAMMDPEFMTGLKKLKPGLSRTPIKTQYGYHVVRLDNTRMLEPLPFEQIQEQLKQSLINQRIQDLIKQERDSATIRNLMP